MTEAPKKKNLWQLLNTPVKDLVKKDTDKSTEPVQSASEPKPAAKANESDIASDLVFETGPISKAITQELDPAVLANSAASRHKESTSSELQSLSPEMAVPVSETTSLEPRESLSSSGETKITQTAATSSEVVLPQASTQETASGHDDSKAEFEKTADPELTRESPESSESEPVLAQAPAEPLEPAAETAADATETASDTQKRKKSLWEILNTPVQDLFKEGQLDLAESNESEVAFLGLGKDKPQLEGKEKASWLSHFRQRLSRTRQQFADSITRLAKGRSKVDEDMLEELEEILLQSDVGIKTTDDVLEHLRQEAKQRRFLPEEVLPSLTAFLEKTLESEAFVVEPDKLNIFLIVGVNGTGKTTTVGKIAAKLKISGYKVMIAAGDTFRAAAIDQLGVWGKRVGCPVIQHHDGADAAAVVFDAIQSARAKKMDALLIDTAGRLHNKDHLMEELKKVHRIIEREKQDARVECILVLDATTGQNGLRQAEVFSKSVPLDSLILTKLDGTAKGGVIFGIKRELGIPIKLLGVGEHLGDLQEFDPKSFVQALFAQEDETADIA